MKPVFSIIIPAYNVDSYIEMTLKSVYNQTFTDYEIIVIDDGSTDKTSEILSKQTDSRLRVIRQNNAGVSAARNTGINAAQGKYIAFLDADDAWTNDHLALAHLFFSRHSDFVWYCSAFKGTHQITDEMLYPPSRKNAQFEARNWILEIAETIASAKVVILRSAITDEKLFPEGVKMCEDTVAFMKIAIKHPMIGYLDSTTLWYRRRKGACYNYVNSADHFSMEELYLSHFRTIIKTSTHNIDIQLYETCASLDSWWKRICTIRKLPWITELKQRKHLLGFFLIAYLLFCSYLSVFLCKVVGRLVIIAKNFIRNKMKQKAFNQRKKLSSVF